MRERRRSLLVIAAAAVLGLLASAAPAAALVPDPRDDPKHVALSALTPSTGSAYYDRPPVYDNGCHVPTHTVTARFCVYGDPHARKVMVAFGDSHIAQWWGALNKIAWHDGYRLLWATKSACPAPVVSVRIWRTAYPYAECDVWRQSMLKKIADLPRLDVVVMGGYHWHQLRYPGTNTLISKPAERQAAWRDGLTRSIRRIRFTADHIMILRDTVNMWREVPACLSSTGGDTTGCAGSPRTGLSRMLWRAERQVAAEFGKVRAVQMTRFICADTVCGPVTSTDILRYRDDTHLTTTYVKVLSVKLRALIRKTIRLT